MITAIYMLVVTIFSVALNTVAAFITLTKAKLNSQAMILFSLTVGDAVASAFTYPLSVYANYKGEWTLGAAACSYYGFATFAGGLGSIYHLLLLSLERYVSIVHPFKSEALFEPFCLSICLVFTWVFAIILAMLPFTGWTSYVIEGIGTSCALHIFSTSWADRSFTLFCLTIAYILPMSTIIYLNSAFLKEVFKIMRRSSSIRNGANTKTMERKIARRETKIARQMCFLVAVLIISFNLTWVPYAVIVVTSLFNWKAFSNPLVASIPSYFAKSYTLYDPIILFGLDKKFRIALCNLISCKKAKRCTDRVVFIGHHRPRKSEAIELTNEVLGKCTELNA